MRVAPPVRRGLIGANVFEVSVPLLFSQEDPFLKETNRAWRGSTLQKTRIPMFYPMHRTLIEERGDADMPLPCAPRGAQAHRGRDGSKAVKTSFRGLRAFGLVQPRPAWGVRR